MNDQGIFTPEELDENLKRKHELIELVASGEAVLIVGAGSSARVGYPDWPDLLKKLEELASECGGAFYQNDQKRKNDPLGYAEDIKSYIRDKTGSLGRYQDLLYNLFQPKCPSHDKFHRQLIELPFRGILTTNYDTVLKEALEKKKKEREQKGQEPSLIDSNPLVIESDPPRLIHEFLLARNNDPRIQQRIAHLHGTYRNSESIILSSKDYQKAYGLVVCEDISKSKDHQKVSGFEPSSERQVEKNSEWTFHRKLLWAVLATRRVVFVGFSMNDPYLNKMLETVSEDLWGWGKSIHFAIMNISSESAGDSKTKARKLKSNYGVSTVFYEVSSKSHQGLDDIITEIAKKCNVDIQSDDDDLPEDEQLTPVASTSQERLDWLEKANQLMEKGISDEN